jgi:hypothetical protein
MYQCHAAGSLQFWAVLDFIELFVLGDQECIGARDTRETTGLG